MWIVFVCCMVRLSVCYGGVVVVFVDGVLVVCVCSVLC